MAGDSTKAAKIEVVADAKRVTWNGRRVAVTQAPRPVELPTLTTWKYKEEAPESAPGFDDSTWTTADRLTANNPELAGSLPVLAMDEYGYHHGNVWYRGRFRTTGRATGLALNANTGPTGQYAVWLNGRYLGSSGDGAHTFDILAGTLKACGDSADNVLSVLVENAGHNEECGHDYSKEPRGLLGAEVVGGASTVTWKIQGSRGGEDPVDTARGPYNNGGLYGERAGWSLAGFPDGSWKNTTLAGQSAKSRTGVRWYRTSARLDLPQGQDNAIALDLAEAEGEGEGEGGGTGYRAQIFVNGWLIGRYLPDTGPQTRFVIPKGILREQGGNTIALAVWSTEAGAGPGSAKLVGLGATAGGIKLGTVTAPSYDAKTYAMPDAGARVTVDAEPFLSTGTAAKVPVTLSVPKDAPAARNVELALKVPDGWTATTDDTTRFARLRPGDTVTADYTVTPPADPVHYAVLSATAELTQPGRAGTVTGVGAVQVPPRGLSADADVSDLTLVKAVNGWGPVEKDASNGENAAGDDRPLNIGGTTYAKGLGVHANSQVRVYLGGGRTRFTATAGVDDEVGDNGSVSFKVIADGRSLFDSPVRYGSDGGTAVDVDVTGARWLDLLVDGDGDVSTDHADWEEPDALFGARPSLGADKAAAWGPEADRYDTTVFDKALTELLLVAPRLRDSSAYAYAYDLADVTRQVLSNRSRVLLPRIKAAYEAGDRAGFDRLTRTWLSWMKLMDKVLATSPQHLLGRWLADARSWGGTRAEKDQLEYDARSIITTWGGRESSEEGLHDYANREWAGLVGGLYLTR